MKRIWFHWLSFKVSVCPSTIHTLNFDFVPANYKKESFNLFRKFFSRNFRIVLSAKFLHFFAKQIKEKKDIFIAFFLSEQNAKIKQNGREKCEMIFFFSLKTLFKTQPKPSVLQNKMKTNIYFKTYFLLICFPTNSDFLILKSLLLKLWNFTDTLNNVSLKYQRFTSSCCKDIGIRESVWV